MGVPTFALVTWRYAGMRLEELSRTSGLSESECTARAEEAQAETMKTQKRATCLREPFTTIPRDAYECADCWQPTTGGKPT